jgi:hypothetical protein
MATRSRIAIENQDGSVISVYCHWDGHIETNGVILNNNYNTKEKVEELIALGNLSSLDKTLETTVAYARDRGEDSHQATYSNVEELFEDGFSSGVEYVYCFTKDGIWLVSEYGSDQIQVLSEVLEEESLIKQFEEDDFNKRDTGF